MDDNDAPNEPTFTLDRIEKALAALGLNTDGLPNHAAALGALLAAAEFAALVDVDRLGQESLLTCHRDMTRALALTLASDQSDRGRFAETLFLSLAEDRLRRTALELSDHLPSSRSTLDDVISLVAASRRDSS
ncbi:hypothetical protein [Streptomyces sp. NPDC002855]|uniref:hypothetical protein n=1 Tax=Streptomyces sp. NPDC002855 TaxID=3154437 RepID=UPI003319436D